MKFTFRVVVALFCILIPLFVLSPAAVADFAFVHPGLLNSREDLARMKQAVAGKTEPIFSGYEAFRTSTQSQPDYHIRGPLATVGRNPTVGQGEYDSDANAAYQCALMWCITGDIAYANKSKEIINAWSSTLKSITGRDAVLMAGLGPFKMVNAAELLRYTDAEWTQPEIAQTEQHFREVIYPVIQDFAPFANGNWDTAALKTMLAISVFCNDRPMFERALDYYIDGVGDGRLTHYIINDTGQCQESGRDQQHTQLGLAHLGDCCEIAWHQGLDLYGYANNRLLKAFEYTAKYNLGEDVPFVETLDRTGKYHHTHISDEGRGRFRAVFEEIANHYINRCGLPAPYTRQTVQKIRPEGAGGPSADHVGYGTLLFAQSSPGNRTASTATLMAPGSPAGLIAHGSPDRVTLTWVGAVGARSYTLKRRTEKGAYQIIARNTSTPTFIDTKVKAGQTYHYMVSASNPKGESADSMDVAVGAGLPQGWKGENIGTASASGEASFDGRILTFTGAGTGMGGTSDQFQGASRTLNDDCTLVARFVPQTSSQSPQFGLTMRENSAPDAAHVSLLLSSEANGQIEAPGWNVRLVSRDKTGTSTNIHGISPNLAEPAVTSGRLTGFCWLKLERSGDTFVGSFSPDGKTWTPVGIATPTLKRRLSVGLGVASRIPTISTRVSFDHVTVQNVAPKLSSSTFNTLKSPDGQVSLSCFLRPGGVPTYSVAYKGKPIVLDSRLGLLPDFTGGFEIAKVSRSAHTGQWTQVYGERKVVPDNYNELSVDLKQASGRQLRITFAPEAPTRTHVAATTRQVNSSTVLEIPLNAAGGQAIWITPKS